MPAVDLQARLQTIAFDLHSALLGEITPNIRGVTFMCDNQHTRVRFIFDGPLSSADEDTVSVVDARFSTYVYDGGWSGTFAVETLRLDEPAEVAPFHLGVWAYRRREEPAGSNPKDSAFAPPLPQGWEMVDKAGTAFALMRELQRETGNERHVLNNRDQAFAIARSIGSDDVLFTLSDGRVAVVHLTWSGTSETDPIWPSTHVYDSILEFRQVIASEGP